MDTYGLQGHPLPSSRQQPVSIQVPLDPSGRVNCLRVEREMQERKTSRASRKHAAHPSPTTYDQTDSRDRLAAPSSPGRPPGTSPTARRSPCRLPALGSNHLAPGRAPQRGNAVLAVVGSNHFPLPSFYVLVPSFQGVGSCSSAPLKCLNSRTHEHLLCHLASQPHWTNGRAQLLGGGTPKHQLNAAAALAPSPILGSPRGWENNESWTFIVLLSDPLLLKGIGTPSLKGSPEIIYPQANASADVCLFFTCWGPFPRDGGGKSALLEL